MRLRLLIILAASLVTIGAGNADSGKDKVATCAACHGQDGNSMVGLWPSLAGQNVNYLVRQLKHIKSGKRPITEMIVGQFCSRRFRGYSSFLCFAK